MILQLVDDLKENPPHNKPSKDTDVRWASHVLLYHEFQWDLF